jgi:hypothetical protein
VKLGKASKKPIAGQMQLGSSLEEYCDVEPMQVEH